MHPESVSRRGKQATRVRGVRTGAGCQAPGGQVPDGKMADGRWRMADGGWRMAGWLVVVVVTALLLAPDDAGQRRGWGQFRERGWTSAETTLRPLRPHRAQAGLGLAHGHD
ncbi:hypothetical protein E4U53_002334 [Claviceps sorghi]|nr:hypothetical protein E4U53_002334 [Claviceps sorghi]